MALRHRVKTLWFADGANNCFDVVQESLGIAEITDAEFDRRFARLFSALKHLPVSSLITTLRQQRGSGCSFEPFVEEAIQQLRAEITLSGGETGGYQSNQKPDGASQSEMSCKIS